jgi:hypothetical protein
MMTLSSPDNEFDEYLKSGIMLWHFMAEREKQKLKLKDAIIAKLFEIEGLDNQ